MSHHVFGVYGPYPNIVRIDAPYIETLPCNMTYGTMAYLGRRKNLKVKSLRG